MEGFQKPAHLVCGRTVQGALLGLNGDVWVRKEESWALLHQFDMGLEFDGSSDVITDSHRSRRHLPSASLPALQLLRLSLQASGSVALNVQLKEGNSLGSVFKELLEQAVTHAGISAAGRGEANTKLEHRLSSPDGQGDVGVAGDEAGLDSHMVLTPEAGETIDVSVCPLRAFDSNKQPVLVMAGLTSPITQGNRTVKYAALVLCSETSTASMDLAVGVACGLAATFMDDTFVETVSALPTWRPEGVVAAFETFLSSVIIVPTVYVPNSRVTSEGGSEHLSDSLLADSLADTVEKYVRSSRGLPTNDSLRAAAYDTLDKPVSKPFERRSRSRQTFYLQVTKFCIDDKQWYSTHCLRQGLEIDLTSLATRPQMPCISMQDLASVRELITPAAVALDVSMGSLEASVDVVVDQLLCAGLPQSAAGEVKRVLNAGAQSDTVGLPQDELFRLHDTDEACHVFEIPHIQLRPCDGFFGVFFRLRCPAALPFARLSSRSKFLFILVGSNELESELSNLGHSLAVLATDEDLMERLTSASDVVSFLGAIDARLNDLTVIPSTSFANLQAGAGWTQNQQNHQCFSTKGLTKITEEFAGTREVKKPMHKRATNSTISTSSLVYLNDEHDVSPPTPLQRILGWKKLVVQKMQKYSLPLVFGVLLALFWSNVDENSYYDFTHDAIIDGFEIFGHDVSLHFIVNDIFMCFFFGLAIKEVTEAVLPGGSLYPISRAANPLLGTMGGIVVPIAVYFICVFIFDGVGAFDNTMCVIEDEDRRRLGGGSTSSSGREEVCKLSAILKGWGVPTATDISLAWMFALIIFGAGHPAINVLLLLAIVDDAIGMMIIAVFYPDPKHPVQPLWLLLVLASIVVAYGLRFFKVPFWQAYVVLAGPISWLGLIKAHVHPALALVVVVPFMPDKIRRQKRSREGPEGPDSPALPDVKERGPSGFTKFRRAAAKIAALLEEGSSRGQKKTVNAAAEILHQFTSAPLHAFEHALKLPVDLGMFFFGLANAGVQLGSVGGVTASVLIALLVGKTFGIAGFSLLAARCGFGLPAGIRIPDLFALSALGGVGLTVALFVSNEAFSDPGLQAQAKMGAVLSVLGALLAWVIKVLGDMCYPLEEDFIPDDESCGDEVEQVTDVETSQTPMTFQKTGSVASAVVDELMVEDILQVMWTVRKYRSHGSDLPLTEKAVRAGSKTSCVRRASKTMRNGSKESNGAEPTVHVPQVTQVAWSGPGLEDT